MNRHLVTVKIRIVGRTNKRMKLDGLVLNKHRLESLYAQTVKSRSSVEKHGMLLDHFVKSVPYDRNFAVEQLFRYLYRCRFAPLLKFLVDKRPEELKRHLLGYSALMKTQIRTHGNNRSARVINPFPEKVLPESALFALDYIAQTFQRPVIVTENGPSSSPVFQKRVNRLLEHPLFISDYYVGSAQFEKLFQPVIPVNYPPVEVVKVRGGKTSAIKRNKGPQIRRQYWNSGQNHPFGTVFGLAKRFAYSQSFCDTGFFDRRLGIFHACPEFLGKFVQVYSFKHFPNRLGSHADDKFGTGPLQLIPVFILGYYLSELEIGDPRIHNYVSLKVKDPLQILQSHVKEHSYSAGNAAEKPYVSNRGSQFNMAHSLSSYLGGNHLHTAFLARYPSVLKPFIFSTGAFVVFHRPEYLGAEKTVSLRFERPVVYSLRLLYLTA